MTPTFEVLDEVELLEFFGADPVERSVEGGYWCYVATDERGVTSGLTLGARSFDEARCARS